MPTSRICCSLLPAAAFLCSLTIAQAASQPPVPAPSAPPVPAAPDTDVVNDRGAGAPGVSSAEDSGDSASAEKAIVPTPEEPLAPETPVAEPLMNADVFLPTDIPSVRPPRGTLGITYFRHTHPVPDDKHPRLGMLAVRDKQRFRVVVVRGMSGLRLKNGAWLFESDRPLDPGVSHIVCIEAKDHVMDVGAITKRYVRLIPGRIVYLDFSDPSED